MSEPHEAAITTFLRVRPCKRSSGYFQHGAETDGVPTVDVEVPTDEARGLVVNNKRTRWRFGFGCTDSILSKRKSPVFTSSFTSTLRSISSVAFCTVSSNIEKNMDAPLPTVCCRFAW